MPLTLPVASDSNAGVGGAGYFYLQQAKDVSGAALGTPDTFHKVSKITALKFTRKSVASSTNRIVAKTNAYGEEIYPTYGLNMSNSTTATQPPDFTIDTTMIESSLAHLKFYDTVRGNYFYVLFPLGSHGGQLVSFVAFCSIEDGGSFEVAGDKVIEIGLKFKVENNTVAATPNVTGLSDVNVGAITPTIAINAGFVWVGV